MSAPRVSVVVPAYEAAARIANTLGEVARQTFADFEIVVVDDGSRDGTAKIVRRAMAGDRRIRLVAQENRGVAAARNRGVAESRGELVAFLDDDDLWSPRKLALQVARLDARPQGALVSCYSALVDDDRRLLGWRFGGPTEGDVAREMIEWDMVSGGSVAMVRRRAFEAVGGFDESLRHRADWDLWIRMAQHAPCTFVAEPLVGYTRRAGNTSRAHAVMIDEGRTVLARALGGVPELAGHERALAARDRFGVACFCLIDGEIAAAWRHLAGALRWGPTMILREPRRWGVIGMLALATCSPRPLYARVLAAMGRRAFGLSAGERFESLDAAGPREREPA